MTAKVQFVIDEAASVGALPPIEDALDKLRSYGVRLILAYQSMGQLHQAWPEGKAQVLLSNTTQIFVGVCDNQTAEYVSARLGAATIEVAGTSTNSNRSSNGLIGKTTYSRGQSTNWSYLKRELLQPAEVMALPQTTAITFSPGLPPIATKLVRFFEDPGLFTDRSFLGSARLFFRSASFLVFSLLVAVAVMVSAPVRLQRPPTPSVGQGKTYGTGQKLDESNRPAGGDRSGTGTQLDRKGGGAPGRPR
jgi:type IV secretion system protein VirD4